MTTRQSEPADIGRSSQQFPATGRAVSKRVWIGQMMALFAGNIFAAVTYDALPPVLPAISDHFGGGEYGDLIAQLSSTMPMFGVVLSGLFGGLLIERYGIRAVLLIALVLYGIVGSIGALLNDAAPLLGSRLALGLMTGLMMTCGASIMAARYGDADRPRMAGALFAAGSISAVLFLPLAGVVASISWRAPFLLHGAVALLFLVPVLTSTYPRISGDKSARAPGTRSWGALKPATPAFFLGFGVMLVANLFSIQLAFLLDRAQLGNPSVVGAILAVLALCSALGSFSFAWVLRRFGSAATVQLIFLGMGISLLVLIAATSIWMFVLGCIFGGVASGMGLAATVNLAVQRVALDLAPRVAGFATAALYLGASSAPLITFPIRAAFGLTGQYVAAAILCIGGVILYSVARAVRRRA